MQRNALRLALPARAIYTERMCGYGEATNNRPGSRRVGGPILLQNLWPALRENLREVYMTNGEPTRLGAATVTAAPPEAGREPPSSSFSKAA